MGKTSRTIAVAGAMLCSLAAFSAFAADHTVSQSGKAFEPSVLTIKAGDTITFVNNDFYDHNMYSDTAGSTFNLGIQAPGETSKVTLKTSGTVVVECKIHPKMKLTVTVQ